MRDDPGLGTDRIAASLEAAYGLRVAGIRFLPLGHDLQAAVYEVVAGEGAPYFLKIRSGPGNEPGLLVPRALIDRGVPHILAPLPTLSGELSTALDGGDNYSLVLYPFIRGRSAQAAGMSAAQWRAFGATLRAVHDSGLEGLCHDRLRREDFALPSAALVRRLLALVDTARFEIPAAARFAAFWRANAERIRAVLARAEALGRSLQGKRFPQVLCHGDIHAANILVGDDGTITLIDWDAPLIAPRERDLLFVIGSRIARRRALGRAVVLRGLRRGRGRSGRPRLLSLRTHHRGPGRVRPQRLPRSEGERGGASPGSRAGRELLRSRRRHRPCGGRA